MQTVKSNPGDHIYDTIAKAMGVANETGKECYMSHNQVPIRVYPGSHEFDIEEKWHMAHRIQQMKLELLRRG